MLSTVTNGFVLLTGWLVIIATVLPLLRADAWWVRVFDFPRVQILFIGVAVLAARLLIRPLPDSGILFPLFLAAALLFQAWQIFPYTLLARVQARDADSSHPGTTLRLMVANVEMSNRNDAGFRALIAGEQPDLFLVVEADSWWEEQLRPLQANYPHAVRHPLDNTYGMLFYSRYEIIEAQVRFLVEKDIPSFHLKIRLPSDDVLDLKAVHPKPPAPQESETAAPRDAELLLVGKEVKRLDGPVIVAGDLNDVAWSRTTRLFQRISSLLDPRIGRGRYSTFHARYPFLRWPLDHVFFSDHFRLMELRVLPGFGSDHFPILVALNLEPQERNGQEPPPVADEEDRQEADEKIREGRQKADG